VTHPASVPFSYFGVVETLFPEQRTNTAGITGIDWSGFDTLAFDAKVSTNTATNQWAVRLEDTDFTNEWNNVGVSLPPLTTTFQPVSIAMSQFLNGGDQTVDLSRVAQVVFQVAISNGHSSFDPLIIDLVIDNLHVYSSTSSAAPFRAGIGHRPLPGGRTEFTVTFPATNDVIHEVQFRESLSTGGWSGLPGSPHDRGCANDNAPATTRFYRVVRSTP
jgi:hypothetical protein